jgi:predicted site-specific integrase-resolvase
MFAFVLGFLIGDIMFKIGKGLSGDTRDFFFFLTGVMVIIPALLIEYFHFRIRLLKERMEVLDEIIKTAEEELENLENEENKNDKKEM